jgi:DNA-binding transcriptional ArsR family regulator
MTDTPFLVSTAKQLRVLASPGREEIIDAVGLLGPCSVSALASFLGRSRHALYYHVRALHEAGLVVAVESGSDTDGSRVRRPGRRANSGSGASIRGSQRAAQYDLPGRPLIVRYDLSTPRMRGAVVALARSRLRSAARGFKRGCDPALAVTEGPRRNLWVAHWKGWLSEAELEEANTLLSRLVTLFRYEEADARTGRRPHELTFAVAPIPERLLASATKLASKGAPAARAKRKRAKSATGK